MRLQVWFPVLSELYVNEKMALGMRRRLEEALFPNHETMLVDLKYIATTRIQRYSMEPCLVRRPELVTEKRLSYFRTELSGIKAQRL